MFIPSGLELGKELESALVLPCSKHELFIRDKIVLLNPGNPFFSKKKKKGKKKKSRKSFISMLLLTSTSAS